MLILSGRRSILYDGVKLVFDGNSITYGYSLSNPATDCFAGQLENDYAPYNNGNNVFYNFGVVAQTTQDMQSDAVSQLDSLIDSFPSILVAWEITNDIYFGATAQEAFDNFAQYCSDRQAAGFKVVAINCLKRNQTTDTGDSPTIYNQNLDTANALLAANWRDFADVFVNIREVLPDYTYLPDGIHPNQTGHDLIAAHLARALRRVPA